MKKAINKDLTPKEVRERELKELYNMLFNKISTAKLKSLVGKKDMMTATKLLMFEILLKLYLKLKRKKK